jgi:cytochrome c2
MRPSSTTLLAGLLLLAPLSLAGADQAPEVKAPTEVKQPADPKAAEAKATTEAKPETKVPAGKAVFLKYKCSACHEIATQNITKKKTEGEAATPSTARTSPDLSGVGLVHKPEWIQAWLARKETIHDRKHWMAFRGSPEELTTLVAWLGSLKDEKAAKALKENEDK